MVGAALIGSSLLALQAEAAPQMNIGILDVNRIISEAKAAKDINQQMEKFRTEYQTSITAQEKSLRAKEKKLAEQQKTLEPKAFAKKKKAFEQEVMELQKSIMAQNQELQKAAQASMEKIRTNVISISEKLAKAQGYAMILPSTVPVYFEKQYDITTTVITQLDKNLPSLKVEVKLTNTKALATKKPVKASS